ncbi:hypothetical protein [Actinomadura macrotermitis]|uniref:Uncharacterized protein n=1 Tax=Actinomadura macrotermitis TaxID=2585200 RepID=A0A7K0BZ99_9ACTN|nr:hypothetical protein [Actinomadura macrotermitis]MQY06509.1 hypothetical protein [Actinomadura macrotermitis]
MLSRSAGRPVLAGLGTAAVLAAGAAPAAAAPTPTPSTSGGRPSASATPTKSGQATASATPSKSSGTPSKSSKPTATKSSEPPPPTTPPPPKPQLYVSVTAADVTAAPGQRVALTTRVLARGAEVTGTRVTGVRASSGQAKVGGECPAPFTAGGCTIGTLPAGHRDTVLSTVTLPKDLKKSTTVTLTVTVKAANAGPVTAATRVSYVVPKKAGKSKDGKKDSGGSSGASSTTTPPPSTPPPAPNGTFTPPSAAKDPKVALPPITTSVPSPSVAPAGNVSTTPASRLRSNKAPVAQELTFERMASTQVAWLAALMVAVSLLLTQLRLGGRRPSPADEAARRAQGVHRRGRRGVFGR